METLLCRKEPVTGTKRKTDYLTRTSLSQYTCQNVCDAQNRKKRSEPSEPKQQSTNQLNCRLSRNAKKNFFHKHQLRRYSKIFHFFHTCFQSKIQNNSSVSLPFDFQMFRFRVLCNSTTNLFLFLYFCLVLFSMSFTNAAPSKRSELILAPSINTNSNASSDKSVELLNLKSVPLLTSSDDQEILENSMSKIKRSTRKIKSKRNRKEKKHRGKKRKGGKRKKGKGRKNKKRRRKENKKNSSTKHPTFQPKIKDLHKWTQSTSSGGSPRKQRLYNKNGHSFHLAVWRNGTVSGEKSDTRSRFSILEIRGIKQGGIVTIMGVKTKKYICTSKKGTVKARKRYKASRCRFRESMTSNKQNTYESLSCKECYLNLNKKGKVRRLNKANPQLVQSHFLPRKISKRVPRHNLSSNQGESQSNTFTLPNKTQTTQSPQKLQGRSRKRILGKRKSLSSKPSRTSKKQTSKKARKNPSKKNSKKMKTDRR